MVEETKHDLLLKRAQITIAILAGTATLIVGVYNAKKVIFPDSGSGSVSAKVLNEQGNPVSGAQVELLNTQNSLVASTRTGEDGAYQRKGLSAGGYILKTSAPGYEPTVTTVQVASGQSSEFNVYLRPLSGPAGSQIRSALEEAGAGWIRKLSEKKD